METSEACLQMDLDETRFELTQGAIVMDGRGVGFWGARGVQHLFLGSGRCFDLTCGVGGADRLFLQGASTDHEVRVSADVLTLWHAAHATEIRLHASRGPRELVFDDGAVMLGALWRSSREASALLGVVGEVAACAHATVANHVNACPRMALGALPMGALMQLEGPGGVETVYAGDPGASVQLDGRLADYKAWLSGGALALSRRFSGLQETAYVVRSARLTFADGGVRSEAMVQAVRSNEPWPEPHGEALPVLPRITAVALDVDSADIDWAEEWPGALPSGLFGGCRAGQVFEASVFLEDAVNVDGAPRLHLCVGGRHRAAQFSGGSGTNTLRFVYTVTEDDVAQGAGSETRGLTLTGRSNLDVEVGPVLAMGASIRAMQSPLLQADALVGTREAANQDQRGWWSLLDVDGCGSRIQPDLELDLILDIDLSDLETAAESARSGDRRPVAQLA